MYCSACGRPVSATSNFCPSCGAAVAAGTATSITMTRPAGISVLAVLNFIGAGLMALVTILVLVAGLASSPRIGVPVGIIAAFCGLFGAFYLLTGVGLWKLKPYGRILQIVESIMGLLGFPLGTIISIVVLVYMFNPGIKAIFSGRPSSEFTADEAQAVQRASSSSAATVAIVAVGAFVLLVFFIGIVAAIAIPGLLRARIAGNEASAIGRLRTFLTSETMYAARSGGAYGGPECLTAPSNCIDGYSGSPFIDPEETRDTVRSGYRLAFYEVRSDRPSARQIDLDGFVITALPVTHGSTGFRAFCADASQAICFTRDGRAPSTDGGRCGACEPLQ